MTTPPNVEYRIIELTQGQICYVSPHRYEELSLFNWQAVWNKNTRGYYARRHGPKVNGRFTKIYMHRQILGLARGNKREGDHKDRTRTLDNTDFNLRLGSNADQQHNQGKRTSNRGGYKGVDFYPRNGMWRATIRVNWKKKFLGFYKTAYEAHLAYCYAAMYYFGEFACFE